jgi:putative CGCGG family rSAM target protein
MAESTHDHDAQTVTDRTHDTSWSANLEKPRHADRQGIVVEEALAAVAHTTSDTHVNLVTHADHGHPETYLYDALAAEYGDEVDWEYVEQCGCGGHVVRVHV